jgi:hypothetical protein
MSDCGHAVCTVTRIPYVNVSNGQRPAEDKRVVKRYALALLLLGLQSPYAAAIGPNDPANHQTPSTAEKYSRSVSAENPFGIDYGFHPALYMSSPQGVPTHQLSMFHAQILFAESRCTATPKPTRFQRGFHNIFVFAYDKDLDKPYKSAYNQAVEEIKSRYQNAWDGMDESQRARFCAEYWSDVAFFVEADLGDRVRRLTTGSMFYLGALSPISSESIAELERKAKAREERERILGPIVLLGQVLALAAGASAGFDSLSAQKAGNFSLAQARMAQSRSLLGFSSGIGSTVIAAQPMDPSLVPSQQPVPASCRSLAHFDQYDAGADSDVWKTYQSLATGCEAFNHLLVN